MTKACAACGHPGVRTLFNATDRLYHTTKEMFQIVECERCRLIQLHPQPAPSDLVRYYPKSYWYRPGANTADRLSEAYRRFVLRDHIAFVRRALESAPPGGVVLDVGCGGGLFLRMLAPYGRRSLGLDWSEEAARLAWRENGVPAVRASLTEAPVPQGGCSAITMFHVLEHVHDPVSYIRAAHDLLGQNGVLVVQVPNAASWQFRLFGRRWNGLDVPRHLFDFRACDIRGLLGRCGFAIVREKYFSLRDNPPGMATSIVPSLDPMARRLRSVRESGAVSLMKDAVYFGFVLAAIPFTLFEAACRAGSTVMIEARKQ